MANFRQPTHPLLSTWLLNAPLVQKFIDKSLIGQIGWGYNLVFKKLDRIQIWIWNYNKQDSSLGSFKNHVDIILLFFDHLPTLVDIFYVLDMDKNGKF